jgi:nondiscriminating glutamyl-tRNA synthetase
LFARSKSEHGKFIIRIEDTDQSRHVETGLDSQLQGLRWFGLDWDESVDIGGAFGPYRQMERLDHYRTYLDRLMLDGHAYHCYCSETELEAERAAQEAQGKMPQYSRRCLGLSADEIEAFRKEGRKPTVRFRVPTDHSYVFEDEVRGRVEFEATDIGDWIMARPDGIPTYNYAVVIDDALMHITHVIRGEEHLSNTPRQLMVYEALGLTPPKFGHLPLILNQDRKKMSKRDESIVQFIEQYRELGYLPEAILNFIVLLGWSPGGEQELFTKEELVARFNLERIAKSGAVFDAEKLNWMNNHYLRAADLNRVVDLAIPHLVKAGRLSTTVLDASEREWVKVLVALYLEQLRYVAEIVELSDMFFVASPQMDSDAATVLTEDTVPTVLRAFATQVEATDTANFTVDAIKAMIKQVQTDTGCKGKQLFMPIRAALTGQTHGRDLNQTIWLLGREKVLARLHSLQYS